MNSNHFVFVAPMFNASTTLPRLLHSLYAQSYPHWHLVLIDDVSDSKHQTSCKDIINRFDDISGQPGKVDVTWNSDGRGKRWEVDNVLYGISMCDDDDIICRIDADDCLVDLDALAIVDSAYQATGCEVAWSMHRWGLSDKNISAALPPDADPYRHPWVSSHLKTFRKKLINNISDENFRGEDGNYIRRAGDQAIYLPILKNTNKRFFIPRVLYSYTIEDKPETYQTDDARFQRDEAVFLRHRGYLA